VVLAPAAVLFRAAAGVVAAQLIAGIATVVGEVAHLGALNAVLVGALVLGVQVAGLLFAGTEGHVVLVAAITAVVHPVADLVAGHASVIGALEPPRGITIEVTTDAGVFVAAIAAVVGAVAQVGQGDAQVVVALEPRLRTVATAGEARRTSDFVGHVAAVAISVAPEVGGNAVAGSTLERTVLALIALAVHLVRVVTAVVLVVALPPGRDALAVAAAELRFGALPIATLAHRLVLVTGIATIVREVAHPLPKGGFQIKISIQKDQNNNTTLTWVCIGCCRT